MPENLALLNITTRGRGTTTPQRWRVRLASFIRLGWGVLDQGMSSLTNFAMVIYIARTLGASQLGAFSLAYVTYGFALNASRGIATEPLVVRFSNADTGTWRRAVGDCTGTALVTGLVSGVFVLLAAALLRGTTREGFIALGLTLPALLLQDSWRFAFFALGRGNQALINDTIWGMVLLPGLILVKRTGHANVFWFVITWGAAAAVAAAVGPVQARVMPKPFNAPKWLKLHRDLGLRYLAENTSGNVASQLRTYGLGIMLSLSAIGYLQAAATLMGPFQVVLYGITIVMVAEAARVLNRSPGRLVLFCVLLSAGLATCGLLWGIAVQVALPRGLGNWILGSIWRPTYSLVLPTTIGMVITSLCSGASAGLHALGAARRSMRTAIIVAVAYLVLNIAGALVAGVIGSLIGAAIAALLNAVMLWYQLRAALAESDKVSLDQWVVFKHRAGRHRRAKRELT